MSGYTAEIHRLSPFVKWLGLAVEERENGICRTVLNIREAFLNSQGYVHGGVIYSQVDTSMGTAIYSLLNPSERTSTIEIKINYLKPSHGKVLICTASIVQKGKNIAVVESEVRDETILIAKAMGTFSIFKSPRADP